jgi:hypothetical protein
MKNLFILFFLGYITCSFSQEISLNLNIEWRKDIENCKKYKLDSIPYLVATYNNRSMTPFYFYSIFSSESFIPPIFGLSFYDRFDNSKPISTNEYPDYSNQDFNVLILEMSCWEILSDSTLIKVPHETEIINEQIQYIHKKLEKERNTFKYHDLFYSQSDINNDSLSDRLKKSLIFLNPKESRTFNYMLGGFMLLGGNYTFNIENIKSQEFIYIEPTFNEKLQHFDRDSIPLPTKTGQYLLYKGVFVVKKTSVKFVKKNSKGLFLR